MEGVGGGIKATLVTTPSLPVILFILPLKRSELIQKGPIREEIKEVGVEVK